MNIFIIATVYHLKDVEHEKISVYFSRSPTDNGHHKFGVLLSIECWGCWSLNTCVVCVCMCGFIPKSRNRTHSALPRFPWISMSECLLLPRVLSMKFILLCMVIVHSFSIVLGYLCLFINSVFKFIHSATDIFFFFAHFPNVLGYLKSPCSKHSATDFSTYVDVNCVCAHWRKCWIARCASIQLTNGASFPELPQIIFPPAVNKTSDPCSPVNSLFYLFHFPHYILDIAFITFYLWFNVYYTYS